MATTDLSQYKKLEEIDHILLRKGMFIGDCENITCEAYVPDNNKMIKKTITYNPAILKLFDEIISNSVDASIRDKSVDCIWVDLWELTGQIRIKDNGGIPVLVHPEYDVYVPELIFGHLRAGSNFEDGNRQGAGMNGLGSKLASIFSEEFTIETNDKSNTFIQQFSNNLKTKTTPSVKKDMQLRGHTTITFTPDYARFNCALDEDNILRIKKRVYDVAGCNPDIKVYWCGQLIKLKSFEQYVQMYVAETADVVCDNTPNWNVCVSASNNDTFAHTTFVNGVDTFNGGTHVDYVCNSIVHKVREFIKKKHKIEVKPNNIKQQMHIFVDCTVNAPTFPSQTKDFLSTQPTNYQTEWVPSAKFMKLLLESSVVEHVLDWAAGEERKAELAELKKANQAIQKGNFLKKIVKFDDATAKDRLTTCLILTEGDSAAKSILSARDPKTQGVFPLRGKMLNVRDIKISKIIANEEIHNLCAIIGLQIGKEAVIQDLRFNHVVLATDADDDGAHILGLFINFINEFWPNLIAGGFVYRLQTPIVVITKGKESIEFLNGIEYDSWVSKNSLKGWHVLYQKGLGGWDTKEFNKFLHDPKYKQLITFDDIAKASLDLAFDKKKANERKDWLGNTHV